MVPGMSTTKFVKDAGFLNACTTRSGWALRDANPYQLRRLTVFNTDTLSSFAESCISEIRKLHGLR